MAPAQEVTVADLPPELLEADATAADPHAPEWQAALRDWAARRLELDDTPLLPDALPCFERIMIEAALAHTNGRKREAAEALGWGRNTLTRKLADLNIRA